MLEIFENAAGKRKQSERIFAEGTSSGFESSTDDTQRIEKIIDIISANKKINKRNKNLYDY